MVIKKREIYPVIEFEKVKPVSTISHIKANEIEKVKDILNDPKLKNWSRYVLEKYLVSLYE